MGVAMRTEHSQLLVLKYRYDILENKKFVIPCANASESHKWFIDTLSRIKEMYLKDSEILDMVYEWTPEKIQDEIVKTSYDFSQPEKHSFQTFGVRNKSIVFRIVLNALKKQPGLTALFMPNVTMFVDIRNELSALVGTSQPLGTRFSYAGIFEIYKKSVPTFNEALDILYEVQRYAHREMLLRKPKNAFELVLQISVCIHFTAALKQGRVIRKTVDVAFVILLLERLVDFDKNPRAPYHAIFSPLLGEGEQLTIDMSYVRNRVRTYLIDAQRDLESYEPSPKLYNELHDACSMLSIMDEHLLLTDDAFDESIETPGEGFLPMYDL